MAGNTLTPKNYGISILRIISCFGVLVVHLGQHLKLTGMVRNITDFGAYGPQLFMIISGYLSVLTWEKKYSVLSVKRYYKSRVIRLLPLYFFSILFFFVTSSMIFADAPSDSYKIGWFRYIFLLNGIVKWDCEFWKGVGMTYSVMQFASFYLIFPLLIKCANNLKKTVISFVCSVFLAFCTSVFLDGWFQFLCVLPFFLLGMVAYYAKKENKQPLIALISTVCIIGYFAMFRYDADNVVFIYALTLAFMLLVLFSECILLENKILIKVIDFLDGISYPIYIAQGIIFVGVLSRITVSYTMIFVIAIFGSFALSVILHYLFEKPIQKLLLRRK